MNHLQQLIDFDVPPLSKIQNAVLSFDAVTRIYKLHTTHTSVILSPMRLPNRKPGKYTFPTFDPRMTAEQLDALKSKLHHLKTVSRPRAIEQTRTAGENGDYSENAEYQLAKGRLRGMNKKIDELEHRISHAEIIETPQDTNIIHIGHTVTLALGDNTLRFTILGSNETNPAKGIISYSSPLGAALLGHAAGETIELHTGDRTLHYTILSIEQKKL